MKNLYIFLIMLMSIQSMAQTSNPERLLHNFFVTYETQPGQAVRNLYHTNEWTVQIQEKVDNVVKTVEGFTKEYMGEYYGFELVKTDRISDSFVVFTYLMKYDRQPLRYVFKFYKAKDTWVLFSFALDDTIDE